ncbi:MAG: HD domain-containing protein, partial [Ruminiclostridium sp.]|nr:HD domain-containing protein [Ruminiclostridium sp.]
LFSNSVLEQQTKLVEGVANVAAGFVDGDSVDRWLAEGEESEGYKETEKLLYNLKNSDNEIEYVYVYKILEDGCHVVFDLDTQDTPGSPLGTVIVFDESFNQYIPTLLSGGEIAPIVSDDTFGNLLTVYKPISDSSGKCVAYAGCDVSMSHINNYRRNFFTGMCSLFFAFFIVIFAVVLWVVVYHIVLPVNSMAKCTGKFAFDSDEELETGVENMKKLEIHTGDEIENLYNAVLKMESDSVQHLEDIGHKNETIRKMQNALILVLADMVESRDKNTGDHVRKTAAYVRIILKKMQEKGYYTDNLTDKFVEDVCNSAPLHDVGKIKVSDMILNKPGRLNDDEFVIMQSHAVVGGEIIDQVINLVPEPDYLKEARNLARSHHEKWNGKGYPEGLSGDDIPLSARIMAVADVFDALLSKRSYKAPFSFEQACDIIREGSGTHFDPLVVDAFLDAGEECRKIAESFGNATVEGYVKDDNVDDIGQAI